MKLKVNEEPIAPLIRRVIQFHENARSQKDLGSHFCLNL